MSRAQYAQTAQAKMSESNLWLDSARADLRLVYDSILLIEIVEGAVENRCLLDRERRGLEMDLTRIQANAASRLRQIPSLIKTARALRLAAIELEEQADNREWAKAQEDYDP